MWLQDRSRTLSPVRAVPETLAEIRASSLSFDATNLDRSGVVAFVWLSVGQRNISGGALSVAAVVVFATSLPD